MSVATAFVAAAGLPGPEQLASWTALDEVAEWAGLEGAMPGTPSAVAAMATYDTTSPKATLLGLLGASGDIIPAVTRAADSQSSEMAR